MDYLSEAIRKIEVQQPKEHTSVWGLGEQLKDMLRAQPELAEIVCQDLDNKGMGIAECERKIKARADEIHRMAKGGSVCVTPMEAEEIIRKFYGLPIARASAEARISGLRETPDAISGREPVPPGCPPPASGGEKKEGVVIELADFF